MRTLIVLCSGGLCIGGIPLYLCKHPEGLIIAEKVLQGIYPESYDRIVFSILREEDEKFKASEVLLESLQKKYPIEVFVLQEISDGPAAAVYEIIRQADIEGEFAVRDSLGEMSLSSVPHGNFVVGLDMLKFNDSIQRMKSKGFIIANEQNIVLDFMEKRFSSDIISVGLYGFRSVKQFIECYDRLNEHLYSIKRLSVGHVLSYMIGYFGRKFYLHYSNTFEDWGDSVAWYAMQKRHATAFVDLNMILEGKDISSLNSNITRSLSQLSARGLQCVFYCSNQREYSYQEVKEFCEKNGIRCVDVISRHSYSTEKYFIDSIVDIEKLMLGL